ncbi:MULTISPECIES: recombination regulator RecX [unclassified Polynucleobacter]|uniref:recombination regulator RecX n=1 Tax=unclassified Polynucleobacter TaxID=2640945 RepID=UPI0024913D88|nr:MULTISPECIES: recombination regulator RecX [unclassified Polynucleobacter]
MTKSNLQKLEEQIEQIESDTRPKSKISLLGRGIRYLSMREHSEAEIRKKLHPYAENEEELNNVIHRLKIKNFLSNERFSESLIHKKAKTFGNHRLAQELRKHDLEPEIISKHLLDLKKTESKRAYEVWLKKFGTLAKEPKDLAKQIRFMVSRGFDQEIVYRIVRGKTLEDSI